MVRTTRILTGFFACVAPLLVGAGKPTRAPDPFVPALAYKYGSQELRLSNADGSQAVLLAKSPRGDQPLWLSLAPLSKRQVAYIEATSGGSVRSVRIVSWTQDVPGGPLTVAAAPAPLLQFSVTDTMVQGVDFSPDGSLLVVLTTDNQITRSELRFFDVATRSQIGATIPLSRPAMTVKWRSYDSSVLLYGSLGMSSFNLGDGSETVLYDNDKWTEIDTFKGNSPFVMIPVGSTTQRWDGSSISSGAPVLEKLVDGLGWSISCDNNQMAYTQRGAKSIAYILTFATGQNSEFSRDSSVQRMTYPKSCD